MQEILVSVLMTCYNRENYIVEAIESVLKSSYKNFELIIVDDCSADQTVNIAKEYEQKDARIKLFVNEKNLGDYANRNRAASYAVGKYLKYCDSDDMLFPWTLNYCVEEMERYPEAAMGVLYQSGEISKNYLLQGESIQLNFFQSTILNVGPSATIIRKDFFDLIGGYKADYGTASDMYFNLKMAYTYPIVLLKKEFFFYRRHEGQEYNNRYSYVCNSYKYLYDALQLPEFPVSFQQKKFLLKRAEYYYVKDIVLYLKNSKKVGNTYYAYLRSGMNFFKMLRGATNLLLIKGGLKKFSIPPIDAELLKR